MKEMRELVCRLWDAGRAYYGGDALLMTDLEYDRLVSTLQKMEEESGIVLAGSPTRKVQGVVLDGFKRVRHGKPMLSAQKTKSMEELEEFAGGRKVVLSWKLDGLTLVLRYVDGKL